MKTVFQIIEAAGGVAAFDCVRIENPPFMALVIEELTEPGPNGHRALSIAHYGEQNGDQMRDPEICAEVVEENGAAALWPYYFRDDYTGIEHWNRRRDADGSIISNPHETRDFEKFMEIWDQNIFDQGFLQAFQRTTRRPC